MMSVPRFLITTALEETWRHDRPTLFLGEWARRYERRRVWESMDALVAEPFGLEEPQRERNFEYLQALSSQILKELALALNRIHRVDHSERYWQIVLGHWLTRYLSFAFNRYYTVEHALRSFEVSGTAVLGFASYDLSTDDSLSFIWACNDDVWNHVFYSRILAYVGNIATEFQTSSGHSRRFSLSLPSEHRSSLRGRLLAMARRILPKLAKPNDAFILNSHMPLRQEVALQLSLGQCPQLWSSPRLAPATPSVAMRTQFVATEGFAGFEGFARTLLGEVIPACYVEGYAALQKMTEELPWPEKPKFIYTASNFDVDEAFKVWSASKVRMGVPYFVGQHGAGYGTHKYFQTRYAPEQAASDGLLTWGWHTETGKAIPAFLFNATGLKRRSKVGRGGLLLVEASMLNQITHWDNYYEFGLYQEEQFRFAAALPEPIRKQMSVRLHGSHKRFDWADVRRWQDHDPSIRIEIGAKSIRQQIEESRLVVFAYDSTGILECLHCNIPTLAFWRDGLNHLLPEALPFYQLLIDAGVLHFDPEAAAEHLAAVWGNIGGWWYSDNVQKARTTFCEQYARSSTHPIRELKALLTKERQN